MKKILFSFLAISLLFISCNDKDTPPVSVSENDLIGTWNLTEIYSKNAKVSVTTSAGVPINANVKVTSKEHKNTTTTLTDNPKKAFDSGTFILITQVSSLSNSKIIEQEITADPNIKSDWTLSGDILNFSMQNGITSGKISAQIIQFDGTTLKLKAVVSENFNLTNNDLGVEIKSAKLDGELYLTYKK